METIPSTISMRRKRQQCQFQGIGREFGKLLGHATNPILSGLNSKRSNRILARFNSLASDGMATIVPACYLNVAKIVPSDCYNFVTTPICYKLGARLYDVTIILQLYMERSSKPRPNPIVSHAIKNTIEFDAIKNGMKFYAIKLRFKNAIKNTIKLNTIKILGVP